MHTPLSFTTILGQVMTLTFDLLASKFNQFIFVFKGIEFLIKFQVACQILYSHQPTHGQKDGHVGYMYVCTKKY